MGFKISILGATGNVGREFISIMEERKFPVDELFYLLLPNQKEKNYLLVEKK